MSTKGGVIKGLAWMTSGRLASSVVSFVSTAILARLLLPAEFGLVAASLLIVGLANVAFDGAFALNLLRSKEINDAQVSTTAYLALSASVLLCGLIWLTAGFTESFFGFPGLAAIIVTVSLSIPGRALHAVATALLQRAGRFKVIAIASLTGQVVGFLLIAVPMALCGMGVWALVAATVASSFVEAAIVLRMSRLNLAIRWDALAARECFSTGLYGVANLFNWIANAGANAVVGRSFGAADLGLYSRGWKLLDLVVAATATPVSKVLLPAFTARRNDEVRMRLAFVDVLDAALPIYAIASVMLTLHAELVVTAALGSQWLTAVPIVQIFFATLLPRCAFKISENFAMAGSRAGAAAIRQAIYAVLMVGGAVVGAQISILGVSIAVSIAITVFYMISLSLACNVGRIDFSVVVTTHVRTVLVGIMVGGSDLLAMHALKEYTIVIEHLGGISVGMLVLLMLVTLKPDLLLGKRNAHSAAPVLKRLSLGALFNDRKLPG